MRPFSDSGIRLIIHGIGVALGQAYLLTLARLAGLGSSVLDSLLERDYLVTEIEFSRREPAILRAHLVTK